MKLAIGDRVLTPAGEGTVVGTVEKEDRHYRPPEVFVYVVVELDDGRRARWFRVEQLEQAGSSSRGEHEAESLASERRMEAKHGEL